MESNEASTRLEEVTRLRSATRAEAFGAPRAAWPVMAVAMALFISSFTFVTSDKGRTIAAVGWTMFVVLWVGWLRLGRGARPGRLPRTAADRRRYAVEWVVFFVVCNLIVQVLGRVSWALAGVAMAVVCSVWAVRVNAAVR
jgi:hypothetical protein